VSVRVVSVRVVSMCACVGGWVGVCVVFRISVDCMYVCRVYCVYCICVCVVHVDQ